MSAQQLFAQALADLWKRDGIAVSQGGDLATRVVRSFARGDQGSHAASQMLVDLGIRDRWNSVLRRDRAAALAARIGPLVNGPLLDVLAGDGSVSKALSDLGVGRIIATERSGAYSESVLPPQVAFEPFPDDFELSQFEVSTALLSTVLHHEPDAVQLLDALAATSISQWIIIENCVSLDFSRDFHRLADLFFNSCLNDFGVHCGDQHRTLAEWTDLLALYGTVSVVDEAFSVPGIPFPYSLLIVNR